MPFHKQQRLPFVVTIDGAPVDSRKTVSMRAFVSAPEAVLPVASGGPWKRAVSSSFFLSEEGTAAQIDIEAESYRWSLTRHVHSNSIDWPFMSRSLKTEKTLTITRERLQTQDVIVYGMWFGTPPNHDDPVSGEIRGKFTVTEIFDDGESSEIEVKVFKFLAGSDHDKEPRIIAFGHKDISMLVSSSTTDSPSFQ